MSARPRPAVAGRTRLSVMQSPETKARIEQAGLKSKGDLLPGKVGQEGRRKLQARMAVLRSVLKPKLDVLAKRRTDDALDPGPGGSGGGSGGEP